jgi:hypothetical protein
MHQARWVEVHRCGRFGGRERPRVAPLGLRRLQSTLTQGSAAKRGCALGYMLAPLRG